MRRCLPIIALLAASCDFSTGKNIFPPGPAAPDPSISINTPAGVQTGTVAIAYTLIDADGEPCSITVEFSANGGAAFAPATRTPGGEETVDLIATPSPGMAHTFLWNSLADGVGTAAANATVQFRIRPTSASEVGAAQTTGNFTVDNSANTLPSVVITPPGAVDGLVSIAFMLTDAESNPSSIAVEFSINSGGAFAPATDGPGGDGRTGLTSSPAAGTAHTWVWNSVEDIPASLGAIGTVQIRITPSDGTAGLPVATADFPVDNSPNTSGGSVATFGPGGDIQDDLTPATNDVAQAMASDGRFVYVAGHDSLADSSWHIHKYDPISGAPVGAFGTAGEIVSNPAGGIDRVCAMVVDGSSLYVVGLQEDAPFGAPFIQKWRIEKRLTSTGALVGSFGTGGVTLSEPVGDSPKVSAVIAGTSIVLAGTEDANGDLQTRIEARSTLSGALGYSISSNVNAGGDGVNGLATDGTSLYLAGFQDLGSDAMIRIEKRSVSGASLDGTFDGDGAVVSNPGGVSSGEDIATAIAADGSYLYVLATSETPAGSGSRFWRIEKRNMISGASFGSTVSTGMVTHSTSSGSVTLAGSSVYVAGPSGPGGNEEWRIEKRSTIDLSLVTSFGTSGVVSPGISAGTDTTERLMIAGGVLYASGQDSMPGDQQWHIEARWR